MQLTPDKWQRAKTLFDAVLQQVPADRASFLAKVCPEDDLRAQVEELLRNHDQAGSFLSKPVVEHHDLQRADKSDRYASGTIVASRFKIVRLLGKGGMGEVFEAEDVKLRRQVALKFLPEELSRDPQSLERFEREARAASGLDHPNICTVYEVGEHAGLPFIAMQFLDGKTLQEHIAGKALKVPQVLDFGIQITDALNAAHSKGIIHRDIKPANIFITTLGQTKILDFGLAKHEPLTNRIADAVGSSAPPTASLPEESLTSPGSALGTVAYMSPEQVRGEDLDNRTDLFSFGAVLYEMATGQHAYSGRTTGVIFDAILNHEPTPPRQSNPQVPLELEQIIAKTLEKDQDVRYQHASDIRADLKRLKRDSESGRTSTTIQRGHSYFGLGRWLLAIMVVAVVGGVLLVLRSARPQLSRPEIKQRRVTANPADNPIDAPVVSHDGKYLAYSDKEGIRIKLLQTGETQTIPPPAGFNASRDIWAAAAWFPDTTRLIANSTQSGITSIWVISILRGSTRMLRSDGYAWSTSPDGSLIAFTSPKLGEIWLMGPNGEEPRRLPLADDGAYWKVTWQPDGERIAYFKWRQTINLSQQVSIESRSLKTGQTTSVWSDPKLQDFCYLKDGRVIFSRFRLYFFDADSDLWELQLNKDTGAASGKPLRLTNLPGIDVRELTATADGKSVFFLKASSQAQVYVGEFDPRAIRLIGPHQITHGEATHWPTGWTPDSRAVLFSSDLNGSWEIYKQALDKTEPELLVAGPELKVDPRLSPDGKWILYTTVPLADPYEADSSPAPVVKRIPASGGPTQFVASGHSPLAVKSNLFRCGHTIDSCVWSEISDDQKQLIFYAFDPIAGIGARRAAVSLDLDPWNYDISPDGSLLAWNVSLHDSPHGVIRIFSFKDGKTRDLKVEGWNQLASFDWAVNGKGFFVSSAGRTGSTLLYIDLQGRARPILHLDYPGTWGAPSPDGHYLAILGGIQDRNVWMLENF
jgi:serine/threonine protein kinase